MSEPETQQGRSAFEVMLAAVVISFMVSLTLFYLYLRVKRAIIGNSSDNRASPLRFILSSTNQHPHHGLDSSLIQSLPATAFRSADIKEGDDLQCAVCISELSDGEAVRLLPKCSHCFHLDCIDMWLHSNNTCPLCRSPVCETAALPEVSVSTNGGSLDMTAFPANVLVWGSRDRVTSRMSVIQLPSRVTSMPDLPSARLTEEEMGSSEMARVWSLQDLLRREGRERRALAELEEVIVSDGSESNRT